MKAALVTTLALAVAFLAGRAVVRRSAVLLLGRQGRALAPAVVASVWLVALLVGQVTHSVAGMSLFGAAVLLALAVVVCRRFSPLRVRPPLWTWLDWGMFLFIAVVFWSVDLWDVECHQAIAAHFLRGNVPPTALNDPRFPLAYHAIYDGLVAVVLTALPIDLQSGMAIVSIACVSFTFSNLQALSRTFFRDRAVAQLARALFVLGFGPIFIRTAMSHGNFGYMHGRTAETYVDLILRRPAGLGVAFFTLAVALIVPCYRGPAGADPPARAARRLVFLVPVLVLLPQMAEETLLFLFVLLAPLALTRRLSARTAVLLFAATLLGALRSGVVLGILGHRAMATPTPHLVWPPRLPSWFAEQTGLPLLSGEAGNFYFIDLGPVFLAALGVALAGREPRRRVLGAVFLAAFGVAVVAGTGAWKRSDLDRFFFYTTPPIFMLAADLPQRVWRLIRGTRAGRVTWPALAVFGLIVCAPGTVYPGWQAERYLSSGYRAHALSGALGDILAAVRPGQPVLTTLDRADELVMAGFMVIAPMDTNSVARVTVANFDAYVAANAGRAVWLFLPDTDPRLAGRPAVAHNGNYVLAPARVPATRPANSR